MEGLIVGIAFLAIAVLAIVGHMALKHIEQRNKSPLIHCCNLIHKHGPDSIKVHNFIAAAEEPDHTRMKKLQGLFYLKDRLDDVKKNVLPQLKKLADTEKENCDKAKIRCDWDGFAWIWDAEKGWLVDCMESGGPPSPHEPSPKDPPFSVSWLAPKDK